MEHGMEHRWGIGMEVKIVIAKIYKSLKTA